MIEGSDKMNKSPIFEAITCCLSCALQPDSELQKANNDRLRKLEVIEEYPLTLCEIIGCNDEALAERHLASVFLKNYLEQIFLHKRECSFFFEKGHGKKIALMLLNHLEIPHTNLKIMVSYNLAILLAIGFWDVLTLQLNEMTQSKNPETVNNAVLVLAQVIDRHFFESDTNFRVEHHWFNVLLDVFKRTNIRADTRGSVIRPMFMMMKYIRPSENFISECWTKLSDEFKTALNEPFSPQCDFQFKGEIVRFLNGGIDEFHDYSSIFISPSLPVIANILTHCREVYKRVLKNSEKPPRDISESESDDPTNFIELVASILHYIHSMIDMVYFNVLLDDFDNLLYCIFVFMACHREMEPSLYSEESEKDHHFSMRHASCQILTTSLQKLEEVSSSGNTMFFRTLHQVFQRFTTELEAATVVQDLNYKSYYTTRISEALIFGLSLIKEKIPLRDQEYVFPTHNYINYWTKIQSSKSLNMILTARIIWMCGIFCLECSPSVLEYQLQTVFEKLVNEPKQFFNPLADALCNFLKYYGKMTPEQQCVISNNASEIITCLVEITRKEDEFPLHHSLNALGYFIKAFREIAANNLDVIEDILIKSVNNHLSEQHILKEVNFVVAKLAQNDSFRIVIHDKFLTHMDNVINRFVPNHLRNYIDKALDILNTYALYNPVIDHYLSFYLFMGGMRLLNKADEPEFEVEESAATLLTTLIIKHTDTLKFLQHSSKGPQSLGAFPKLLEAMLQPDVILLPHVCAKLVISSIFEFTNLLEPHFENILRNVITSNCKHAENIVPTWIMFAFICMIRTSATLSYLSMIPGPSGGSALNYIMKSWKCFYIQYLDQMERKIMVLSITRILQHCLENETDYKIMQELQIPCDPSIEQPETTWENLNGMEYIYYLTIICLLYEEKENENQLPQKTLEDYGEDINIRHIEDDQFLYRNHPFNINIINHIVTFLNTVNDMYFSIIRKFLTLSEYYKLRNLGCVLPDINTTEHME
ncbi:importin 9 isoform X2 [Rhynchophorus ferrugineus]